MARKHHRRARIAAGRATRKGNDTMKTSGTRAAAHLPCAADAMKPATVLLIAALAAVLGACGDRSEEAGAPASGPIAEAPQADPTIAAEAPQADPTIAAEAPRADATLTAEATRADTTTSPPVAEAPRTEPATSPPVAQAPPAPATAADSPAAAPAAAAPASQPAQAAPGTVLRAENLYSEPASTSKVTASVAKGASVAILARQGGWLRVKSGNSTGWIRLLSVRAGEGGWAGQASVTWSAPPPPSRTRPAWSRSPACAA